MSEPTICAECKHYLRYGSNPTNNGKTFVWSCDLCDWGTGESLNVVTGKMAFVRTLPSCYDVNDGSCWGFEEWTEEEKKWHEAMRGWPGKYTPPESFLKKK